MSNVLINEKKVARAQEIIGMIDGVAKDAEESRLKDLYSNLIEENSVKKGDRLEYIYVKLGGLVRTESEEKVARAIAKQMKKELKEKEKTTGKREEPEEPEE